MSTRIALTHIIEHRFERRVQLPTHWLRLHPAPHTRAVIEAWSLRVDADPHFLNWVRDPFENHQARLDLPEPVSVFRISMDLVADLKPINPFDFFTEPYAAAYPFDYPEQLRKELGPYLFVPPSGPRLTEVLHSLDRSPRYILEMLTDVLGEMHRCVPGSGSAQPGTVDLEAVLERGHGSAWECAWLLVVALRSLGLAARFDSGYRVLLSSGATAPNAWSEAGKELHTEPRDEASLHAWADVFVPGAGWIGLDSYAGLFTHEGYIPLAATPDPLRALPWVEESTGPDPRGEAPRPRPVSGREQVAVRRLIPAAAPAPYTAAQVADIEACAVHVDQALNRSGLWLAMAPTVCWTAPDTLAPEWTTQAPGPWKRAVAEDFLSQLRERLAPGGVLQEVQREWFNGENLPRWRLGCFFRADGAPIWRNPELLATASVPVGRNGAVASGRRQDIAAAERLAKALSVRLGLPEESPIPAHEDQLYELWQNRAHIQFEPPAEVLRDPTQRLALAQRLSRTSLVPVGYVLPLRWDSAADGWATGPWRFRRGALYLLPGNSSMGYRLPLGSLPADSEALAPQEPERCPFEERPLLSDLYGEASVRHTRYLPGVAEPEPADPDLSPGLAPRTAICVEARDGRIAVFLPPLTHLEHWLSLIAAIEDAAAAMGIPVLLEGYEPPEDFRIRRLSLEPDTGVLSLALPLAESAAELRWYLETAYEVAANLGLSPERASEDGRRLPPGGAAEIALAGGQPALSPFLHRPQLLHSVIAYWQQHPSLSYFFAGRLVGPSGPAPRPDEGRDDALYELGIALARLPRNFSSAPWVPDRALRHLLADPAGDIAKAEIRIDRLYGPDRSSQRQGRIAIGSFDTAPNPWQALVQCLLLRALLVRLAEHPAAPELRNYSTELHDRFMLPSVLWADLLEVLGDLAQAGLSLPAEWFEPFLAQRFPVIGQVQIGDVGLEFRTAHEPWPLLAEEVAGGSVTRFIDSANQRLQISVTGYTPSRYLLLCNGRLVPLRPTQVRGQVLAGVRYKVWNPPSTLQPTVLPVQSLVFDLVDSTNGNVLGGCTWFPARPGLVGAVAPSPGAGRPNPAEPPHWRRMLTFDPALWGSSGRFLRFGSGSRRLPLPERRLAPEGGSYLLDLTRPG